MNPKSSPKPKEIRQFGVGGDLLQCGRSLNFPGTPFVTSVRLKRSRLGRPSRKRFIKIDDYSAGWV